jgi:hypothetical protein
MQTRIRALLPPGLRPFARLSVRSSVAPPICALLHLGICTVLLLSVAQSAGAQTYETVGVRAQGMGGAFVAVADDASATWWNPAGLASGAYFNAILEYDRATEPDTARAQGFAVAFPALGLSYYRLPISQMRPAGSTDQGSASRQDERVLSRFGASVGQSIGNHLVLASTLQLLRAEGDTHAGLDVGALANFSGLRIGLVVKNLGEPSFGAGADRLDLVRQVRTGVALVGRGRGALTQVAVAMDADLTTTPTAAGEERHLAGGLELWMAQRRVGVRAGAARNTIGDPRSSASAGLSVAVRSGTYLDTQLTGGSDPMRKGWGIDFRMTF